MKSTIIHIGKDAIDEKEPILVLFGEEASSAIKNVSILQSFKEAYQTITLNEKDQIIFGDQVYTVEHVGENVNSNLQSLGHVTLVFKEFNQENFLETSVYVSPYRLPKLSEKMEIQYISKQ